MYSQSPHFPPRKLNCPLSPCKAKEGIPWDKTLRGQDGPSPVPGPAAKFSVLPPGVLILGPSLGTEPGQSSLPRLEGRGEQMALSGGRAVSASG